MVWSAHGHRVQEHRDEFPGHDHVLFAVAIDVGNRHIVGARWKRVADRRAEGRRRAAGGSCVEEDLDVGTAVGVIRNDEIGLAVAIEVADRDGNRAARVREVAGAGRAVGAGGADDAGQLDREGDARIVNRPRAEDRDADRGRRRARGKGGRAGLRRIVRAADRGAIGGGIADRER